MMNLNGYNMAGTEQVFEQVLDDCLMRFKEQDRFTYCEFGIAEGQTLIAVADKLRSTSFRWNAMGIDLADGPFFDARKFIKMNLGHAASINFIPVNYAMLDTKGYGHITIVLSQHGTRDILKCEQPIHFCLIDGCHGAPCVEHDFLLVEKAIVPGGVVAFHDAMPEDQGQGWQSHCQMNISVEKALIELGLWTRPLGACARQGWKFLTEVRGNKQANPPGNGFMFFQRV